MATSDLSYTTVRNVNLEPLKEAVVAWRKLPGKIETVSTQFSRTVSSPLEGSGWHGEAAQSAFRKFRSVRHQMSEASGQAEKIGTVMAEALKVFQSSKKALADIEREVNTPMKDSDGESRNYLKLNKADGVVHLDPPADVDNGPALQKAFHETIVSYNKRIGEALRSAGDADHDLKTALQIDPPGKGFNDDVAGHLKDVDTETKKDVDALMKLANKEGFKNDPALLSKFNGILAKNSQNADFAEQFAQRKGAKGILDLWYRTAKPEYEDDPLGEEKKRPRGVTKQLAALQDNMGTTLALASRSDSPEMDQWKKDVIDLGSKRMPGETRTYYANPPYGFQVMSNLMRTGKWDTDFLKSYGDKLVEVDKKPFIAPGGRREDEQTHRKWLAGGQHPMDALNFGKDWDKGSDPFTGYFEALGHNGDASTDFFKDEENFDHVLRDRTWLPDGDVPDSGREKDFNGPRVALGHALGSATTGHDWDAPLNVPAEHTKDQSDLMTKLIKGTGSMDDDGNADISLAPGMREGLGNAAAEYTPDMFRAMTEGEDEEVSKLLPMSGEQADMSHSEATKFLVQLGQDPDANAAITAGQKLYTADVLDHHMGGDVPEGQKYDAPLKDTVHEVLRASGETAGTLASGAQEGIIGPAVLEEQDYDKSTLSKRLWSNTAFGSVVTGLSVTETVASAHPVAAAASAALLVGVEGAAMSDEDAQSWDINKSAPAAEKAAGVYDEMSKRDVVQNQRMLKTLGEEHDIDVSSSWGRLYSKEGFSEGYSRVGSTAPFLTSIEQVKQMSVDK